MKATEGQKLVSSDTQYQIASTRRQSYDNMLWQTPIVSLTGLAFLFLIALSHDTSPFARILASVLALLTSGVSAQLMAKHRHFEILWAEWLRDFEKENSLLPISAKPSGPQNRFTKLVSYHIWLGLFFVYGLAAVTIIVITLICPYLL
jgi:hypothetical protein